MIGNDQLILADKFIDANQSDLLGVQVSLFLKLAGNALFGCFIALHESCDQCKTTFRPGCIARQQDTSVKLD